MRKPTSLQRSRLPARVCETLEAWAGVLLVIGAALLLYATLKTQLAHATELVSYLEHVP